MFPINFKLEILGKLKMLVSLMLLVTTHKREEKKSRSTTDKRTKVGRKFVFLDFHKSRGVF